MDDDHDTSIGSHDLARIRWLAHVAGWTGAGGRTEPACEACGEADRAGKPEDRCHVGQELVARWAELRPRAAASA